MKDEHSLAALCAALDVSRPGSYRWKEAEAGVRARADAQLTETIRAVHGEHRGVYGSPRMLRALRACGRHHSRKRIARLMKAAGLRGKCPRRFVPCTTQSGHAEPIAPNRLAAQPRPTAPNQVWVSDITYIPTQEGWLYVAGVLDRYSRRLLGLAMAARMDAGLPQAALRQALERRGRPRGVILHSDQGVPYASALYQDTLKTFGLIPSMSRRANCCDNAHMESFWGTLKTELLAGKTFATRAQARLAIFEYIETFYNRVRLHSALGDKSPVDFENQTH